VSDPATGEKPRIRTPAGSSRERLGHLTTDAVSNVVARLGISNSNLLAAGSYDFTPLSRMQQMLEWAYRGSWLVGAAVDAVADDMTRCGIQMNTETPPDVTVRLQQGMEALGFWQSAQRDHQVVAAVRRRAARAADRRPGHEHRVEPGQHRPRPVARLHERRPLDGAAELHRPGARLRARIRHAALV
jgi:hypothetical protein